MSSLRRDTNETREEFVVCHAAGYSDPFRPHPNTLDNARAFVASHSFNAVTNMSVRPVIKRRLVSEWEEVK